MNAGTPRQSMGTWWITWAAILGGLPMFFIFLQSSNGAASSGGIDQRLWPLALIPLILSTVIRWAVLPRMGSAQVAMPVFVVGLALAETCCFLGVFLFPTARNELFAASAVGILQLMPFFAAWASVWGHILQLNN